MSTETKILTGLDLGTISVLKNVNFKSWNLRIDMCFSFNPSKCFEEKIFSTLNKAKFFSTFLKLDLMTNEF